MNTYAQLNYVVTTEQMRALEAATVASGTTWAELMERAGRGVAAFACELFGDIRDRRVVVLVGPGNNGGDGLVAARYLRDAGAFVSLYLWRRTSPHHDPNWQQCRQRGMIEFVVESEPADDDALPSLLQSADLVIDALLGMGTNRPVTGSLARIVATVNHWRRAQQHRPETTTTLHRTPHISPMVLAVDVPTGVHSDTGQIMGCAIVADYTVATGLIKRGLLVYPGRAAAGIITVADIGIPRELLERHMVEIIHTKKVRALLPERPADGHKGTFGKVLVVAGSLHYPGAAALATAAAGRVGAGLVTLATARGIIGSCVRTPEVTLFPLPEADLGTLGRQAADEIIGRLGTYQSLLVGPGLGREEATTQFFKRLFGLEEQREQSGVGFRVGDAEGGNRAFGMQRGKKASEPVGFRMHSALPSSGHQSPATTPSAIDPATAARRPPTVLDADALNILATIDGWEQRLVRGEYILTPHPGEMKRLLKQEQLDPDSVQVATDAATRWGQVVVLKGATTVIAAPDGRAMVYGESNPALATAGTGDVLAGVIAGLLAQGMVLFDAAVLGVYLHAQAGAIVREEFGEAGALASDLLPKLPQAIKQLRGK